MFFGWATFGRPWLALSFALRTLERSLAFWSISWLQAGLDQALIRCWINFSHGNHGGPFCPERLSHKDKPWEGKKLPPRLNRPSMNCLR